MAETKDQNRIGILRFFRLKWMILIVGLPLFLAWLVWPVTFYDGYAPTYIAVSDDKKFLGVVKVQRFDNPWQARMHLKDQTQSPFRQFPIGESRTTGYWSAQNRTNLPGDLFFRRENLVWTISPTDEIGEIARGDGEWLKIMEDLANQTEEMFETGTLESNHIETNKIGRFRLFFEKPFERAWNKLRNRW